MDSINFEVQKKIPKKVAKSVSLSDSPVQASSSSFFSSNGPRSPKNFKSSQDDLDNPDTFNTSYIPIKDSPSRIILFIYLFIPKKKNEL